MGPESGVVSEGRVGVRIRLGTEESREGGGDPRPWSTKEFGHPLRNTTTFTNNFVESS